jgi:hypothetical protein
MAKNHTHIAVHTIQSTDDKGNPVEYRAGKPFTPGKGLDVERLEKRGAIRKADPEKDRNLAVTVKDADDAASDAPGGYAAGTQPISAEPGLTEADRAAGAGADVAAGPESSVSSGSSAAASARAPGSRSTPR